MHVLVLFECKGHDMIGVAQTGSGKTLAFVWPALIHLMDQREIIKGKEGPIVVILAPTRELATQIYNEANKFAKRCERRGSGVGLRRR